MMGKIRVGKTHALVDDEKVWELSLFKWHLSNGYACMKIPNKYYRSDVSTTLSMHRYLTKCPKGMTVDHLDGNRLNNRSDNLKIMTQSENSSRTHDRRTEILFRKIDKMMPDYQEM